MKERFDKKGLPDTAWNIRCLKKAEDDPRRHKSRCIYYENGKCVNVYEIYCNGSAHCRHYAVATEGRSKEDERERVRRLKNNLDNRDVIVQSLSEYQQERHRFEQEKRRAAIDKKEEKERRKKQEQEKIKRQRAAKRGWRKYAHPKKQKAKNKQTPDKKVDCYLSSQKESVKNHLCLSCCLYDKKENLCSVTGKQEALTHCLLYRLV